MSDASSFPKLQRGATLSINSSLQENIPSLNFKKNLSYFETDCKIGASSKFDSQKHKATLSSIEPSEEDFVGRSPGQYFPQSLNSANVQADSIPSEDLERLNKGLIKEWPYNLRPVIGLVRKSDNFSSSSDYIQALKNCQNSNYFLLPFEKRIPFDSNTLESSINISAKLGSIPAEHSLSDLKKSQNQLVFSQDFSLRAPRSKQWLRDLSSNHSFSNLQLNLQASKANQKSPKQTPAKGLLFEDSKNPKVSKDLRKGLPKPPSFPQTRSIKRAHPSKRERKREKSSQPVLFSPEGYSPLPSPGLAIRSQYLASYSLEQQSKFLTGFGNIEWMVWNSGTKLLILRFKCIKGAENCFQILSKSRLQELNMSICFLNIGYLESLYQPQIHENSQFEVLIPKSRYSSKKNGLPTILNPISKDLHVTILSNKPLEIFGDNVLFTVFPELKAAKRITSDTSASKYPNRWFVEFDSKLKALRFLMTRQGTKIKRAPFRISFTKSISNRL